MRGFLSRGDRGEADLAPQNDEIEKLSSERFAIYRRCKLEEIELPLEKGSLDTISIDVSFRSFLFPSLALISTPAGCSCSDSDGRRRRGRRDSASGRSHQLRRRGRF